MPQQLARCSQLAKQNHLPHTIYYRARRLYVDKCIVVVVLLVDTH